MCLLAFFGSYHIEFTLASSHRAAAHQEELEMRRYDLCRMVSKCENELHRTTPPEIEMDTSSGGKKPEVTKDPWMTTGCPLLSANVHYQRSTGEEWSMQTRGDRKLHKG